jgi:hypothetical protein
MRPSRLSADPASSGDDESSQIQEKRLTTNNMMHLPGRRGKFVVVGMDTGMALEVRRVRRIA